MTLKNLEAIHASVRSIVGTYSEELVSKLGPAARSLSAYGSVTGPDFVPRRSNVNLVAVVTAIDREMMAGILATVRWGLGKKIVPPLLLTPEYIASSVDVFPIEFVEIRRSQALLFGEDQFAALEIDPQDMRLECESQLKAALLRTRQAYLELGLVRKGVEEVLHASVTSLVPVFRAMLTLKGLEVPPRKLEVVKQLGQAFEVGTDTFIAILRDKAGDEKIGGREAHAVLARYVEDIEILSNKVDLI